MDIQLKDLVVLGSMFQMWPQGDTTPEGDATPEDEDEGTPFEYPRNDVLRLSAQTQREDRELVLYLQADIDDASFPFRLSVLLGARYDVDDPDAAPERVEPTLVWLCYPYLRELIASITTRSPLPPYYIPALTRMPDPSVLATGESAGAEKGATAE